MINMPSLPTDNLYKFLALSGLAIVTFSIVFPMIRDSELNLMMLETDKNMKVANIEKELFDKRIDKFLNSDLGSNLDELKMREEELEIWRNLLKDQQIYTVDLEYEVRKFEELHKELKFIQLLMKFGFGVGLIITFLGFLLWYVRVQKPNDLLLRKQIETDKTQQD